MKGAIFDIDGTVLDSMGAWLDMTQQFFSEHGIEISKEINIDYQGKTLEETLPDIQKKYMPEITLEELLDIFVDKMRDEYKNNIPPKPGVCEYIRRLHDNGIKIAIATSGFPELSQSALKRIGIDDCIDARAFSYEVGCSKSEPDVYLLAARRLGLKPQDCVVFEDIITGIKSAKAAGFTAVATEDIANTRDKDMLQLCADIYISSWYDMPEL